MPREVITGLYEFDPTQTNTDNRIVAEKHTLQRPGRDDYHFIIPLAAPFFVQTLSVRNDTTNEEYVEGQDYIVGHWFVEAMNSTGRPIAGSIRFLKRYDAGIISIDYHTLGGDWGFNDAAILAVLTAKQLNPAVRGWSQIDTLPVLFPPTPHDQRVDTLIGFEEVTAEVGNIATALEAALTNAMNLHINSRDNPHEVNAEQIDLENVDNFTTATEQEALDGIRTDVFLTAQGGRLSAQKHAAISMADHLADVNPHGIHVSDIEGMTVNEILDLLSSKMDIGGTVANALRLDGYTREELLSDIETGTIENATKFNYKTYSQVMADFLSRTIANSEKLEGKTLAQVMSDASTLTVDNANKFSEKTESDWETKISDIVGVETADLREAINGEGPALLARNQALFEAPSTVTGNRLLFRCVMNPQDASMGEMLTELRFSVLLTGFDPLGEGNGQTVMMSYTTGSPTPRALVDGGETDNINLFFREYTDGPTGEVRVEVWVAYPTGTFPVVTTLLSAPDTSNLIWFNTDEVIEDNTTTVTSIPIISTITQVELDAFSSNIDTRFDDYDIDIKAHIQTENNAVRNYARDLTAGIAANRIFKAPQTNPSDPGIVLEDYRLLCRFVLNPQDSVVIDYFSYSFLIAGFDDDTNDAAHTALLTYHSQSDDPRFTVLNGDPDKIEVYHKVYTDTDTGEERTELWACHRANTPRLLVTPLLYPKGASAQWQDSVFITQATNSGLTPITGDSYVRMNELLSVTDAVTTTFSTATTDL